MGGLGAKFVLPKEVYDVQTMRAVRDSGLTPDEVDSELKAELSDFVDDSGQWLSDDAARSFLKDKAEQRAHEYAQKRFGSYTLHSQLANHESEKIQGLAQYALRDGLQGELGVKQQQAVSERLVRRRDKTQGIMLKSRMKHYRGYLTDQGKYAGKFSGMGLRRQPLADFKKEVSFVLQGGKSDNKHVNAMAKDLHEVYATYLQRAKEKGFKWAEEVVADGSYAPRQWSRSAIQRALKNEDTKERLVNTLAKNIEGLEFEDAKHFSALWLNKMARGEAGKGNLTDVERFLNDTDSEDYKAFMSELMESKKGGTSNPQNFKFRIRLKNSSELSDYFESNFETVMMRYVNNMEGHFALAEDGLTMSQFKKMVDDAKADIGDVGLKKDNLVAGLEYTFNLVSGNALTPSTAFGKDWLRAGQGYTYTRLMGNMGIAQLGDLGTLASEMGSGRFDVDYGDEGGGLNYFLDSARQVTNVANGFNLIDDYLRGAALDGAMLKWERIATGKDKDLGLSLDRVKELGLDHEDIKRLSSSLYKHADKNERGRITNLNLDSWENQKDADLFLDATTRYLDKAVQRQHHGERIGFILGENYQPLVQVILQFRSFIFASQNS